MPLQVDAWIRPNVTSSSTVAEILRDYLDATDETFEYIFYERKKDALTFLYNIVGRADRSHMEEAVFTGITVEPTIDLKCPENGASIVDDFLKYTHHDMKWPMLPSLHYEQVPSRMHHIPWSREQQVETHIVHGILKPEIFRYDRISFADAVRECLSATDANFEEVFAQRRTMAVALLRELLAFGKDYDVEVQRVHITGLTAEPVSALKWPDTGKSLVEEVATHCDDPVKWPALPALHLEHGIMDENYPDTHEIVPIYPVPMECVYLSHGKKKLYGYRKIHIANRPPRPLCFPHLYESL